MSDTPTSPKVSVILSSYNYAHYIARAIDSVLSQSYQDFELIIVDDGSEDESVAIINDTIAKASQAITLLQQENQGQASTWNAALECAQGDYIFFLDSDDYWYPEKLECMVYCMERHPEAALFQHPLDGEDRPSTQIGQGDIFNAWQQGGETFNIAARGPELAVFVPSTGLSAPRAILEKIFPIPTALITCPDAYLTRTAITHGPVIAHPQALGHWNNHAQNAGKDTQYGMHQFWLPTIMPLLNTYYTTHNLPFQLAYRPTNLRDRLRYTLTQHPTLFKLLQPLHRLLSRAK